LEKLDLSLKIQLNYGKMILEGKNQLDNQFTLGLTAQATPEMMIG